MENMENIEEQSSLAQPLKSIVVNGKKKVAVNGVVNLSIPQGGGGGGEQVQADWNQNDSTAPDYIKNRPCYEGVYEEVYIDQDVEMSYDDDFSEAYTTEQPKPSDVYFLALTAPDGFTETLYVTFRNWSPEHTYCDQIPEGPEPKICMFNNSTHVTVSYEDGQLMLFIYPISTSYYKDYDHLYVLFVKGTPKTIDPKLLGPQVPLIDGLGNLTVDGSILLGNALGYGRAEIKVVYVESKEQYELRICFDGNPNYWYSFDTTLVSE